jgi:diacylglycerol kinase
MINNQITKLIELNKLDELTKIFKKDDYIDSYFLNARQTGHLEIAKWLYSLGGVDIHAENEDAFRNACLNGYLEIAKWLYSFGGVDIHAKNEYAFRITCKKDI